MYTTPSHSILSNCFHQFQASSSTIGRFIMARKVSVICKGFMRYTNSTLGHVSGLTGYVWLYWSSICGFTPLLTFPMLYVLKRSSSSSIFSVVEWLVPSNQSIPWRYWCLLSKKLAFSWCFMTSVFLSGWSWKTTHLMILASASFFQCSNSRKGEKRKRV